MRAQNFLKMNLEQSHSLSITFTNCLMNPRFLPSESKSTMFTSSKHSHITFSETGMRLSLGGHYFLIQCGHHALLSYYDN